MKFIIAFVATISLFFGLTLPELRNDFEKASKSSANTSAFYDKLEDYSGNNQTILAYKGASKIMKAKIIKNKETKKKYFSDGAIFINDAVKKDSKNVEIRLIRLIIQENIPKFIKYNHNITEDKSFVVDNYASASKEIQNLVKRYANSNKTFTSQQVKKLK